MMYSNYIFSVEDHAVYFTSIKQRASEHIFFVTLGYDMI